MNFEIEHIKKAHGPWFCPFENKRNNLIVSIFIVVKWREINNSEKACKMIFTLTGQHSAFCCDKTNSSNSATYNDNQPANTYGGQASAHASRPLCASVRGYIFDNL